MLNVAEVELYHRVRSRHCASPTNVHEPVCAITSGFDLTDFDKTQGSAGRGDTAPPRPQPSWRGGKPSMADPGQHRLLCKPHPFRDCREVQVGLLKIVEYGVATHLILDLLEGRTFGAQTPVQCPWMQIECRGDPIVRA